MERLRPQAPLPTPIHHPPRPACARAVHNLSVLYAAPLLTLAALATVNAQADDDSPIDFATDIRPLLSDRCFTCHGPGVAEPAGGLRLDLADEAVDELGLSAIVPGDAAGSELIRRLTHKRPKRLMPPADSNLSLNGDEIALFRRWIDEGATYDEHWSFVAPVRAVAQAEDPAAWCRDDVDRHILEGLENAGIAPAQEADPSTLLRRVHLDLTGLPPSVVNLRDFLADLAPGRHARTIDRLLASRAHAEHMTVQWLDVARYADTFGYQSDVNTNVWPWRDWLLDAFASNLPYDEFLTQQLAGDLLTDATQATRLATTFNRLHRQTNEGGSVEEEFRVEYVCDRVETMAGAFLGLTVGCARCHDHKFDPITQRDFFSLFAFFDGIDESGLYSHFTNAVPTPALALPTDAQAGRLALLEQRVAQAESEAKKYPRPSWRSTFNTEFCEVVSEALEGGASRRIARSSAQGDKVAILVGGPEVVPQEEGNAVLLDGENSITLPGVGVFERSDPFTISLSIQVPEVYERAVVLHRTKSWTDSGSRGYQLLIEDGHLVVALVHFWPGDAIAIRSVDPLDVGRFVDVSFFYDGSSRADGLKLLVDGERVAVEVVRDRLTRTIRGGSIGDLTIGSRFRDRGFKGGMIRSLRVQIQRESEVPPHEVLRAARAERDALRDQIRQVMTMRESPALPAAHQTAYVLRRGLYSEHGDPVEPATPAFLPPLLDEPATSRLDLARWLTHPDHPLTARVHVDRLWRIAFGRGLIAAPEDLGSQSPPPRQRALLDALARDLIESGWDSRAMLRRFVLSATYRQSSDGSDASLDRDPDGALFSRSARTRLSAETIRDSVMYAAGLLAGQVGGPSVMPYQPPGLWQEKSGKVYRAGHGDDLHRRSLYTFWRRTSPPPAMALFDAPTREVCRVARRATTTPLQALVLWNDPQFVEASVALARHAIETAGDDDPGRVDWIVLALATREATETERTAMVALLVEQRAAYADEPGAAHDLATYDLERVAHPGADARAAPLSSAGEIELAATAVVASTLLGLDDVVTRR